MFRTLTVAVVCATVNAALPAHAADAYLPYVGRLLDTDGAPLNGTQQARVSLYTDSDGTQAVWRKVFPTTVFSDGYFEIELTGEDDSQVELDVALANHALWVGVAIGSSTEDLTPLKRMANSGYIRLTDVPESCTADLAGTLRYRAPTVQICDNNRWSTVYERPPAVQGGVVSTVGDDVVRLFSTSDTLIVNETTTFQVLLVGGGGAGGGSLAGGGGGGAVLYHPALTLSPGDYPIVVGAGGVGSTDQSAPGGSGGATIAFGQTATGGAGAVGRYAPTPPSGQANGGGGSADQPGGPGIGVPPAADAGWTVHAGFDGGFGGGGSPNYPGGGGAGADANGQTPGSTSAAGGNGGAGVPYDITGTTLYWAGGGGGSSYIGSNGGGNGGLGGGGGGSANTGAPGTGGGNALNSGEPGLNGGNDTQADQPGGNGGANTGGGGGAGNHQPGRGGDGGSGVVIVRH